jgi:rhodanese-related sulfurtransferase
LALFGAYSFCYRCVYFLKELFSNAGIDKDSLVVAYDNGDFFWAARLYWILEVFGHENVGLSKYAYGKNIEENLPITTEISKPVRKEFIPRVDNNQIETKLSTLMSIGKKTIIDGREKSHYEGKDSIAKRFGHIPTALNYACTNNFQVSKNGNYMKEFDELEKVYKDLSKDKEILLYCQGGAESALNYIVFVNERKEQHEKRTTGKKRGLTKTQKENLVHAEKINAFFFEEADPEIAYTSAEVAEAVGGEIADFTPQKMTALLKQVENAEKVAQATSDKKKVGYKAK